MSLQLYLKDSLLDFINGYLQNEKHPFIKVKLAALESSYTEDSDEFVTQDFSYY